MSGRRLALGISSMLVAVALFGPLVVQWALPGAAQSDLDSALRPPSWEHWLGTDELGRDALYRTLWGLRVSLVVAGAGALATAAVGVSLGLWAGYRGGFVDAVVQRTSELVLALPKLPLFLMWAAVDPRRLVGLEPTLSVQVGQLTLAFMLLSWVTMARVVRASALRLRSAPFVEAARALGSSEATVCRRHVLPHLMRPISVTLALDFGDILLVETGLSFLGLGIAPPTPTLGSLLSRGAEYVVTAPHLLWAPGLLTMALVLLAHTWADDAVAEDGPVR